MTKILKAQPRSRAEQTEARRKAILEAALEEFSLKGFAMTRMEDIATKAGVGKGTVYLHFSDKETLFEEILKVHIIPILKNLEGASCADLPLRTQIEEIFRPFLHRLDNPKLVQIFTLIITEMPRFPKLADIYYRLVIERGTTAINELLAQRTPTPTSRTLAEFPQLLIAPVLIGTLWTIIFSTQRKLDVDKMLAAHLDLLFPETSATTEVQRHE
jgi:Transcriptional regulator